MYGSQLHREAYRITPEMMTSLDTHGLGYTQTSVQNYPSKRRTPPLIRTLKLPDKRTKLATPEMMTIGVLYMVAATQRNVLNKRIFSYRKVSTIRLGKEEWGDMARIKTRKC